MPKPKTEIRKTNGKEVAETIRNLQNQGATFTHIHSNYTNTIQTEDSVTKWTGKEMSKSTWIAANVLKKDLDTNPKAGIVNAKSYSTDNYSNAEIDEGLELELDKVINVDITSCYPTTLLINKLISKRTHRYLLSVPKDQRLAAIGMLAYSKLIYDYEDGFLVNVRSEHGKYKNIFFYIVNQVQAVLMEAANMAGPAYLFHWVDGIYLHHSIPGKYLDKIEDHITGKGYTIREDLIKDFVMIKKDGKIKVDYTENGKPKHLHFEDANYRASYNSIIKELHRNQGVPKFAGAPIQ